MTHELGKGFNERNLAYYRKFYLDFPNGEILHTRVQNLTWSHIRALLRVDNPEARSWYMKEASEQMWSVRTLDRNISTQYYFRLLSSHAKDKVKTEMEERTSDASFSRLLCAETSKDIARYSVLNGSSQLFASKYMTYLPSEEDLLREIDRQKEFYLLQKKK